MTRSILYHYTTARALDQILQSGELRPSLLLNRPRDVRHGEGQYLTDIEPGEMNGAQLSRALLGHPFEGQRFTHFLAVDLSGLTVHYGRQHVFVVLNTDSLSLTDRIVSAGRNAYDLP